MTSQAILSRADLVRCLAHYPSHHADRFAAQLGFDIERPPEPPPEPQPKASPTRSWDHPPPHSAQPAKGFFCRVVHQRELSSAERRREVPTWLQSAIPYSDPEELGADTTRRAPGMQPLLPWPRLWPHLKRMLSTLALQPKVDLPALIDQIAQARIPQRVPYLNRRQWATVSHVLIDGADALQPLLNDINALIERLRHWRGAEGLLVYRLDRGQLQCVRRWRSRSKCSSVTAPVPAPHETMLIFSDLGCSDRTDHRRQRWQRYAQRLQRSGCRALVMMPCPKRWWSPTLQSVFDLLYWDRRSRITLSRSATGTADRGGLDSQEGEVLLTLLSPAIRIEPALLRAARLVLQGHDRAQSVGAELALWNHRHVETTPQACYLHQEHSEGYRQRFFDDDWFTRHALPVSLRYTIARLIEAHHRHLSPVIGYEEALNLGPYADPEQHEQATRFTQRLAKTLHETDNPGAERADLWIKRRSPWQPAHNWQHQGLAASWALAHVEALANNNLDIPHGLKRQDIAWILDRHPPPTATYHLIQRARTLAFVTASSATERRTSGSVLATLDIATHGIKVERYDAQQTLCESRLNTLR